MTNKRKTIKETITKSSSKRSSPSLSLADLIHSDTASKKGIRNTPTKAALNKLKHLGSTLEQVVELLGYSISISSAYRSKALNAAVGGSKTSHHTQGLAADFTCKRFGTPFSVCKKIAKSDIQFDQLILEYGAARKIAWVHLGVGPKKRRQVFTIFTASNLSRDGLHRYRKKQP